MQSFAKKRERPKGFLPSGKYSSSGWKRREDGGAQERNLHGPFGIGSGKSKRWGGSRFREGPSKKVCVGPREEGSRKEPQLKRQQKSEKKIAKGILKIMGVLVGRRTNVFNDGNNPFSKRQEEMKSTIVEKKHRTAHV